MANLTLDSEELKPLVHAVVTAVTQELENRKTLVNGRLALSEPEAAELMGLNPWQLRDLRLAGNISFRRVVGNRVRYTLDDLNRYLNDHLATGM